MDEFKPTIAERLIIGMLCDLYKHLKVENGYAVSVIENAVVGPHHWALERMYPFQEPVDEEIANEVSDILDMWVILEAAYERLDKEDRADLDAPRFPGFDLNDETDHYSVADMMINRMDLFQGLKEHDLNSHSQTLHEHRDMLPRYQSIKEDFVRSRGKERNWPPNKQQIKKILKG